MTLSDELENIAKRISDTLYYYPPPPPDKTRLSFIRHDDYDRLREIAKELRGPDGQAAHELGRTTLPWSPQ